VDCEAELLPVGYYTLPAPAPRHRLAQQRRAVYDLLMKAAAETTFTIAADPSPVPEAAMSDGG
jgi:hypothetical protein